MAKPAAKPKRRERKNIHEGVVHIVSTFNNTIISITDKNGNVISWGSAGTAGFKGAKKGTPFAAQLAADGCAQRAREHGMHTVEVFVKGPCGRPAKPKTGCRLPASRSRSSRT